MLICSSLSEWPISVSPKSAGVVLAESDDTDDFLTRRVDSLALVAPHSDSGLSSLSESGCRWLALSSVSVAWSQDRSTERLLPNDLRSLSTSRM